jgi:hypothetical protein
LEILGLMNYLPCWPQTVILLISASLVARIIGMSHHCLAYMSHFYFHDDMVYWYLFSYICLLGFQSILTDNPYQVTHVTWASGLLQFWQSAPLNTHLSLAAAFSVCMCAVVSSFRKNKTLPFIFHGCSCFLVYKRMCRAF